MIRMTSSAYFWTFTTFLIIVRLTPSSQTTCTEGDFVGAKLDDIVAGYYAYNNFWGMQSQGGGHYITDYVGAVIVYQSDFIINCKGLISEWQLIPYLEYDGTDWRGCGSQGIDYPGGCSIDFNVWKDMNPAPPLSSSIYPNPVEVTLVDSNAGQTASYDNVNSQGIQIISIPSNEQIPVDSGYYIGWNSPNMQAVEFWYDNTVGWTSCASSNPPLTCYAEYLLTEYGVPLSDLTNGVHSSDFYHSGEIDEAGYGIYYALRVKLTPGTPPTVSNLPDSVTIDVSTSVGTSVFTVTASDAETKQTLAYSMTSSPSGYFSIDSTTGEITVAQLLSSTTSSYTLQVTVDDGILNTVKTLTVDISGLTTTAAVVTTSDATQADVTTSAAANVATSTAAASAAASAAAATETSATTEAANTTTATTTTTASTTTASGIGTINTIAMIAITCTASALALALSIAVAVMCCRKGNSTDPAPSTSNRKAKSPLEPEAQKMKPRPTTPTARTASPPPKPKPTTQQEPHHPNSVPPDNDPPSRPPSYNSMSNQPPQQQQQQPAPVPSQQLNNPPPLQPQQYQPPPTHAPQQPPQPQFPNAQYQFHQQPSVYQPQQPVAQPQQPNPVQSAIQHSIRDTMYWM